MSVALSSPGLVPIYVTMSLDGRNFVNVGVSGGFRAKWQYRIEHHTTRDNCKDPCRRIHVLRVEDGIQIACLSTVYEFVKIARWYF